MFVFCLIFFSFFFFLFVYVRKRNAISKDNWLYWKEKNAIDFFPFFDLIFNFESNFFVCNLQKKIFFLNTWKSKSKNLDWKNNFDSFASLFLMIDSKLADFFANIFFSFFFIERIWTFFPIFLKKKNLFKYLISNQVQSITLLVQVIVFSAEIYFWFYCILFCFLLFCLFYFILTKLNSTSTKTNSKFIFLFIFYLFYFFFFSFYILDTKAY